MAQPCSRMSDCCKRRPVAVGDGDLLGDQVDAGDGFGHRMLDLDARVHLEEIERLALAIDQELDGARAAIRQALREAHGGVMQRARASASDRPGAGVSSMSF